MHNTDTAVVLRALARSVGLNLMLNEKVTGVVSVDLQAVPWNQAFIGILHSEGLDYVWEGDVLRVMTAEGMANEAKIASIRPMDMRVVPIHFADPAKLQEKLKDALTKDETGKVRGYLTYDEHTTSLVVKASPEELGKMVALIESLDVPTPQIHIVSNIVEATRDVIRQLGVQWGGLYHSGNTYITPGGTAGQLSTTNPTGVTYTPLSGTSGISGQGFGVNLPAPGISSIGGGSLGLIIGTLGGNALDIQLSALEQEGKVNILSTPSLTTLDNQLAYTQVGQSVPVASLTTTGQASVTYIDAVIRLEITPHVIADNILKLNVTVKKDEPDFTQTVQGNPLIDKKETKTTLICADGETVVISGLSLKSRSLTNTGVPGFDNVPVLGSLFKSINNQDQFQDVVIFITPHILKERKEG
jgi:type IV pilus assembly protein PilQ